MATWTNAVAAKKANLEVKIAALRKCADAGMTCKEAAEKIGIALGTAYAYSSRYGIKFRAKDKSGPKAKKAAPIQKRDDGKTECIICRRRNVTKAAGLVQIMEHPDSTSWPRCRRCADRIAGHVRGIRRALVARQAAKEAGAKEGWVA